MKSNSIPAAIPLSVAENSRRSTIGYSPVVDQGELLAAKEARLEIGYHQRNQQPSHQPDEETLRLIHELGQKGALLFCLFKEIDSKLKFR